MTSAFFEDNHGGDCINITDVGDGLFELTVGYQCIYSIQKTGTISGICAFLEDIVSKATLFEMMKRKSSNKVVHHYESKDGRSVCTRTCVI